MEINYGVIVVINLLVAGDIFLRSDYDFNSE